MGKCSVHFCSASGNIPQISHAHFIACRLVDYLAHVDIYIPVEGASGKIGIPSSFSFSAFVPENNCLKFTLDDVTYSTVVTVLN